MFENGSLFEAYPHRNAGGARRRPVSVGMGTPMHGLEAEIDETVLIMVSFRGNVSCL